MIPAERLLRLNDRPENSGGSYVLYWMVAQRRTRWNFAFEHALALAVERGKPLLVLEPLTAGHAFANDRIQRFIMDGMEDNALGLTGSGVGYYPYVEKARGEGRGLVEEVARKAVRVVTDQWPCYFLPQLVQGLAHRLPVAVEAVDGCGILPLAVPPRLYLNARGFRRFLHDQVERALQAGPLPDPLAVYRPPPFRGLEKVWCQRWEPGIPPVSELAIDHSVPPVAERGGPAAAQDRLESFLAADLGRYGASRQMEDDGGSRLSAYLHFGHLSPQQVVQSVLDNEDWNPGKLVHAARGSAEGFWGVTSGVERFLDQLLTWRELGFNMAVQRPDDYARYEGQPDWARATLRAHAGDARPARYGLADLADARTDDPLWNAAQRQLRREGRIASYLRMLWGKRVLEWTRDPREAFAFLVELNDRYAIDGRDPNSYSGIGWVFGRYDRPWFPERPIFGTVRYMSSASTAKKWRVKAYLAVNSSIQIGGPEL